LQLNKHGERNFFGENFFMVLAMREWTNERYQHHHFETMLKRRSVISNVCSFLLSLQSKQTSSLNIFSYLRFDSGWLTQLFLSDQQRGPFYFSTHIYETIPITSLFLFLSPKPVLSSRFLTSSFFIQIAKCEESNEDRKNGRKELRQKSKPNHVFS